MIEWVTAFIDVPADRFDAAVEFWSQATATTPSAVRGDRGEFVTLAPNEGDAHVRLQRVDDGPRVHLDLHVADPTAARDLAIALGATLVGDRGYFVMRSPAGLMFCLVRGDGEAKIDPPVAEPAPHRVDQLCIDVPTAAFEAECAFWAGLFDAELKYSPEYPEFVGLPVGDELPWGFLLQRLGDDPRTEAEAHIDLSCGEAAAAVADRHAALGAERGASYDHWIVMRDPAGLEYCTTESPVR